MKQIIISEEEARALLEELKKNWVTMHNQRIIFYLLIRIEKELEIG